MSFFNYSIVGLETVPGPNSPREWHARDRIDIDEAIARLDCEMYGGFVLSIEGRAFPILSVAGCSGVGYLVGDGMSDKRLAAIGDTSRAGFLEVFVGNQVSEYPARSTCSLDTVKRAVDAFLRTAAPAIDVEWEGTAESYARAINPSDIETA